MPKKTDSVEIIATLPPYVDHRQEIIRHPLVSALRFNSISPLAYSREKMLRRLKKECGRKPLWIDLKGRQLRIAKFAYLPDAYVELNHEIEVELPCEIRFKDCVSQVVHVVEGRRLILSQRPLRVVGEGEPVNIVDSSLKIKGYLTDSDREYVQAAIKLGLNRFMLSFVERESDLEELRQDATDAAIVAKIESLAGLRVMDRLGDDVCLMAARDDLAIQCQGREAMMTYALNRIRQLDQKAIVASRFFQSLENGEPLSLADVSDFELMLRYGYRRFMLSDGLCFHRDSFLATMAFLERYLSSRGRTLRRAGRKGGRR